MDGPGDMLEMVQDLFFAEVEPLGYLPHIQRFVLQRFGDPLP
jgi:hypothetical protein